MTILLGLFLLLSASALAYDFPHVTYRTCYDGDTCRFDIPNVHPLFGKKIPIRFTPTLIPLKTGEIVRRKRS